MDREGTLLVAEPLSTSRVGTRVVACLCDGPKHRTITLCRHIRGPICFLQEEREQLAQIAFEVFNVSGLFFADQVSMCCQAKLK